MKIKIESKQLNNYLTYKLDKLEEEYTKEELETVDELVLEDSLDLDINVLKYFTNLEILEIRNFNIDEDLMNIILSLNNLIELKFQLCTINNPERLKELNLKELHLDCCKMNSYSFIFDMHNLEALTLTGQSNLEIKELNKLINIKYLNISHTNCSNDVLNIEKIEELYIDNSSIEDIFFTLELPNLKTLSLSEKQYKNKKELIDKLREKNIEILDYSIMLLGDIE